MIAILRLSIKNVSKLLNFIIPDKLIIFLTSILIFIILNFKFIDNIGSSHVYWKWIDIAKKSQGNFSPILRPTNWRLNKMIHILVLHGPNLNLLGEREPELYGTTTLQQLNEMITQHAQKLGAEVKIAQSNSEGTLIDFLHENRNWADGVLINPGALTHYSYSLRDGLAAIEKPAVEVHLSNIHRREPFRRVSVIAEVCISQIVGLGINSYLKGLEILVSWINV